MSNFVFMNLTDEVRKCMLLEMEEDIKGNKLFLSERLNISGKEKYPDFLKDAIKMGNEQTLQNALESDVYFNPTELRQNKPVKTPSNAAILLSQSEFNRYYIRGVCLKALKDNTEMLDIYRARESSWKRPESEIMIGKRINAKDLLEDLRDSIGIEPKMFPDINSGLSVRF